MDQEPIKIKPREETFGMPQNSFDPMKTIEMEGELFRGLVHDAAKPLWVRIISLLLGIALFLIAGSLLSVFIVTFRQQVTISAAIEVLVYAVLLVGGIRIIYTNIKSFFR